MAASISKKSSEKLRAIAVVLSFLVVIIHCWSIPANRMLDGRPFPEWIVCLQLFLSESFARSAVPFFFAISGFFLVKSFDGKVWPWWVGVCKKRLITLVIPFVLWNSAHLAFNILIGEQSFNWGLLPETVLGLGKPACGPFWYVRCLILYVLISPILVMCLRNIVVGSGFMLFAFVALFFDKQTSFYVMGGMWIGLHLEQARALLEWGRRCLRVPVLIVFVLSVLAVVWFSVRRDDLELRLVKQGMILSFVLTCWWHSNGLLRLVRNVGFAFGCTFFVYAFHKFLTTSTALLLSQVLPATLYHTVGYVLRIPIAFFGSVWIAIGVRRYLPRLYGVLAGGR